MSGTAGHPPTPAGGSTVDIVGRLKARQAEGGSAEARLVAAILADPAFAASAPIADIAARAGVSEPTITRLARALGFSGMRDMRFHLAQALAIGGAYLRTPPAEDDAPDAPPRPTPVAAVVSGAHRALDLMMLGLGECDVAALGARLAGARRILVCGTGGSSSMAAEEMQTRLFRLGLQANAQIDPQLQRMNASVLQAGDVIVAFSISGKVRSVRDATAIAQQYRARALGVTVAGTPLAGAVDDLLPLSLQEDRNLYKPSSARFALLAAVDILALATAEAIGPAVVEPLRRVRQSLASQDIRDPNHPIGD
jgi:DNA-binding MurR/RpiR family transcriptional regulator